MAELTGISAFCGETNPPGLRLLKYVPLAWLAAGEYEEIISTAHNFQRAIAPSLGGGAWLPLPFFTARGDGWQQGQRKTDQGDEYPQEVSGVIRKLRPEVDGEIELMKQHRFLVNLTDQNGKSWLIGRYDEPLEFTATGETGSRSGGLNSYAFRFTGTTGKRAFGYVPVF